MTGHEPRMAIVLDLVGRALLAALFLWSGLLGILPDIAATAGMIEAQGLPLPRVAAVVALIVEIAAPLALFHRRTSSAAALGLVFYCLATALLFHPYWMVDPGERFNEQAHFFKDLALAGAFLVIGMGDLRRATATG